MSRENLDEMELGDRGELLMDARPFTGFVVECYPDGSMKYEGEYQDGYCVGNWKSWYPNGQLQMCSIDYQCNYYTPLGHQLTGDGTYAIQLFEWFEESGMIQRYIDGVGLNPQFVPALKALEEQGFFVK